MNTRIYRTDYYRPDDHSTPYKSTFGSSRRELCPNITRRMVGNDYGADVAEAHDLETGELLLVATRWIGKSFEIVFEQDVTHPVCITNPEE